MTYHKTLPISPFHHRTKEIEKFFQFAGSVYVTIPVVLGKKHDKIFGEDLWYGGDEIKKSRHEDQSLRDVVLLGHYRIYPISKATVCARRICSVRDWDDLEETARQEWGSGK